VSKEEFEALNRNMDVGGELTHQMSQMKMTL